MAFCTKCGNQIDDNAKFCPHCGASTEAPAGKAVAVNKAGTNSKDYTGSFSQADIEENKLICILSYLGILMLIPLLVKKDSAYVRFHCNQGLILLLFNIILSIISAIPIIGWIVGFAGSIFSLVLFIMGIVNTINGRAKTLPLIGGFSIIK